MAVVPIDGVTLPREGITSYRYQQTATHRHQGIDLHAPLGTPVRSAFDGVVTQTATKLRGGFSGYGRIVVVRGNGVWALYAHLDQVFARKGDHVAAGEVIGTVGRTCFSKSEPTKLCARPHLHFEVSPRAYPQPSEAMRLDPVAFLGDQWNPRIALAIAALTVAWPLVRRWVTTG